jgi:hypothetical protein
MLLSSFLLSLSCLNYYYYYFALVVVVMVFVIAAYVFGAGPIGVFLSLALIDVVLPSTVYSFDVPVDKVFSTLDSHIN